LSTTFERQALGTAPHGHHQGSATSASGRGVEELAFNNITIFPGESGSTAAVRFLQFYRASTVDTASGLALRADTTRSQFNASKPAALGAVGDPEDFGDTFDAARADDLAAMATRQEESTRKRPGTTLQDTPRTSSSRRHKNDRHHAPRLSTTPETFFPRRPVWRRSRTRVYRS